MVRSLVMMGGSLSAEHNARAEFNVYVDPKPRESSSSRVSDHNGGLDVTARPR